MHRHRTALTLTWCVAMAATGCGQVATAPGPPDVQDTVAAGDTVTMRPGEIAYLPDGAVNIMFRGVVQDSRCPADVTCVGEGDAQVRLAVAVARRAWERVDLHTSLEPKAVTFEGYVIRLVEVAPSRRSNDNVGPDDYPIRLAISRP
ncbi:hypothetical protein BH23GEM10_BH23GEM10_12130 [soil metagenome]